MQNNKILNCNGDDDNVKGGGDNRIGGWKISDFPIPQKRGDKQSTELASIWIPNTGERWTNCEE